MTEYQIWREKPCCCPVTFNFFCLPVRLFKSCASLTFQKVRLQIQNESLNRDMTVELIHDPDSDGDVSDCAKSDGRVWYCLIWQQTVGYIPQKGIHAGLTEESGRLGFPQDCNTDECSDSAKTTTTYTSRYFGVETKDQCNITSIHLLSGDKTGINKMSHPI